MTVLSPTDIHSKLSSLPAWRVEAGELARTFQFADFREAMRFVNQVAEAAEQAGHHPDIDIRYNKVRLGLVSHDAGGLTKKDFDLAIVVDKLGWATGKETRDQASSSRGSRDSGRAV
jgi:4a-hydroxytetrahydrobiopterin dehydratase